VTTTAAAESPDGLFLDRDLSWLEFNRRVLHEALDDRTPLLERVKFLSIFTSNLDEFFMKRVGRLKLLTEDSGLAPSEDPTAHLRRIREALLPMLAAEADVYTRVLRPELARHGIHLLGWPDLSDAQRQHAEQYYHRNVFPVLTPLAVDPGRAVKTLARPQSMT
jgi:polyphosphate kinase